MLATESADDSEKMTGLWRREVVKGREEEQGKGVRKKSDEES